MGRASFNTVFVSSFSILTAYARYIMRCDTQLLRAHVVRPQNRCVVEQRELRVGCRLQDCCGTRAAGWLRALPFDTSAELRTLVEVRCGHRLLRVLILGLRAEPGRVSSVPAMSALWRGRTARPGAPDGPEPSSLRHRAPEASHPTALIPQLLLRPSSAANEARS